MGLTVRRDVAHGAARGVHWWRVLMHGHSISGQHGGARRCRSRTSYAASVVAVSPSSANSEFSVSDIPLPDTSLAATDMRQSLVCAPGAPEVRSSGDDIAPSSHVRRVPPGPLPANPGDRKPCDMPEDAPLRPGGVAMAKEPLVDMRLPVDARLPDVWTMEGTGVVADMSEGDERSEEGLLPDSMTRGWGILRAMDLRRTVEDAADEEGRCACCLLGRRSARRPRARRSHGRSRRQTSWTARVSPRALAACTRGARSANVITTVRPWCRCYVPKVGSPAAEHASVSRSRPMHATVSRSRPMLHSHFGILPTLHSLRVGLLWSPRVSCRRMMHHTAPPFVSQWRLLRDAQRLQGCRGLCR